MPTFVFISFKFSAKDLLIDNNSSINTVIMNFFSIDCSTEIGSLFIKTKNKSFIKLLQSDKYENDLLMKQILIFFEENHLSFDDISQIFVNQGPGNFSSLRTSLAIAKGVGLSKNIKISGYNTFIWSCAKFFEQKDIIYSLVNLREKYFIKQFDKNLKSSSKVEEISVEKIFKKYNAEFIVISKNLIKKLDKKLLNSGYLNIVDLDHNDLEFLYLKGLLDKDLIKPLYLS